MFEMDIASPQVYGLSQDLVEFHNSKASSTTSKVPGSFLSSGAANFSAPSPKLLFGGLSFLYGFLREEVLEPRKFSIHRTLAGSDSSAHAKKIGCFQRFLSVHKQVVLPNV